MENVTRAEEKMCSFMDLRILLTIGIMACDKSALFLVAIKVKEV